MLFTSYTFVWFFFLGVLPLRWLLPARLVQPFLLVASYVFYATYGLRYALMMAGLTVFAYGAGVVLARKPKRARLVLGLSVSAILLTLGYFKYTGFLLSHFPGAPKLDIALPLGISFYLFEMISYLVDVHRGTEPARSLGEFFLYIAYFPHLVAGPIVRATELLPHLRARRPFDPEVFSEGMFIALVGFAKKVVLADNLAPFANHVFGAPESIGRVEAWLGVLAYTGQIFCDFSGYTDIARGCSLMLGYPLPENFDYPYLSRSITEFWRRWHMTLSRWLRDYLYISLGGNRRGRLAQYRNLFLTMLLGGLWHGARWTFVAWGAWHGVLLAVHKGWDGFVRARPRLDRARENPVYGAFALALTLLAVMLGWVFFRAETFTKAWEVLRAMRRATPGAWAPTQEATVAIRALVALVLVHVLGARASALRAHRAMPPAARGLVWASMVVLCFAFASAGAEFIYFNF